MGSGLGSDRRRDKAWDWRVGSGEVRRWRREAEVVVAAAAELPETEA